MNDYFFKVEISYRDGSHVSDKTFVISEENVEKAYEKLKNNLDYTCKCNGIIDVKKL
jgi:hypothetical protein